MNRETPGTPVGLPNHQIPAHPVDGRAQHTGTIVPGECTGTAGDPAPGGQRFPCCGLTLACSVYRTWDQLGEVK